MLALPENYSPRPGVLRRASHAKLKIDILISPRSYDSEIYGHVPAAQCLRHARDGQVTKRLHLICDAAADNHVELVYAFSRMILLSAVRAGKIFEALASSSGSDLDYEC